VIIDVPNPELKLRPGMTATVSILINKRENVLRVPTLAIRFQPPQEVLEKLQSDNNKSTNEKQIAQDKNDLNKAEQKIGGPRMKESRQGKNDSGGGEETQRMSRMGQNDPSKTEMTRIDGTQKKRTENKKANVWILEGGKNLKSIALKIGLNDNRFVEILSENLKEGDEVIVGTMNGATASNSQQNNPFGPQRVMMGGPGGGGRGR
jgi:HlyD family secretion protein